MTEQKPAADKKNSPCIGCGGSGQTSYFGGASRFMFTWEDCPDCHGTGVNLQENADTPQTDRPATSGEKED